MYSMAREALIAATQQLLAEHGYESTSPAMIQRRAKAGQGSFYHHFKGKVHLAHEALSATCDEMLSAFDAASQAAGDPLASLRRYLTQPRDALAGCRLGRHALEKSIEKSAIREPVSRYFSHVETALASKLEALKSDGRLPADLDTDAVALALVAVVQGGYVLARPPTAITLGEVVAATQEPFEGLRQCLLEPRRCAGEKVCAIHQDVVAAEHRLKEALSRITLAEAAQSQPEVAYAD